MFFLFHLGSCQDFIFLLQNVSENVYIPDITLLRRSVKGSRSTKYKLNQLLNQTFAGATQTHKYKLSLHFVMVYLDCTLEV